MGGFSLLEVIVAFAIGAIALAVLSQIFARGTRNLDTTQHYQGAVLLAENLLAKVRNASAIGDDHEDSSEQYKWRVSFEPFIEANAEDDEVGPRPASLTELVKVQVAIDWQRHGKSFSYAAETLRLITPERNPRQSKNARARSSR